MAGDPFKDEDSRVLTPEAFEFVLRNELKRAVRSQNFLTLLVVDATSATHNGQRAALSAEVARLVSREVRETDLLSQDDAGQLSIVLLDADLPNSMRVVDRLLSRLEHSEFATRAGLSMGAACCPTHGSDAESLRQAADPRPLRPHRERRGNTSTAQ
jgi:GGDEF domain-containing protein